MAKKSLKRKRSTSEKIMIVLGILIAISMMLSLFIGLGSGGQSNAPLPQEEQFEEAGAVPVSALESGSQNVAALAVAHAPPLS